MGYLKTTIDLSFDQEGESYEQDIGVRYRFMKGSPQTMIDPAELDSIEIDMIEICLGDNKSIAAPWLCALVAADEELLARCMEDHRDSMKDAAERAAEDRAERLRENPTND